MSRYQIAGRVGAICLLLVATGRAQLVAPVIPDHISVLIRSLDDLDPQKRSDAVQRLLNLGEPARAALRLALQGASVQARPLMDRILLHMHWVKPDDSDSLQQAFTGYADLNAEARLERMREIPSSEVTGADAMLRVVLNDPSSAVRWVAADHMRQLLGGNVPFERELTAIMDGTLKPSAMYLPPNENAPLLAVAGWVVHDKEPRRADDLMQRAVDLETQNPSALFGQMDFVFQWLIDRADAHRDRVRMIQLLRQQASRTAWSEDRIPEAVADLTAAQAEYGPVAGFKNDLRTYRNYLGHPQMIYALGRMAERQGHPRIATALNAAALLLSGTSVDGHWFAGVFLEQHEWNKAAEREFRWCLELTDGKYPSVYFRLAGLASERNDELAAAQYEELALQHSTDLTRTDRYGRSVPWLADDAWAEVHWHYLRAARDAHDASATKLHLEKLMSMNAEKQVFHRNPSIVADVVPALQAQGRVDEADKIFAKGYDDLLELMIASPEDAMAKNNLAWLCACAGKRLEEGKNLADQAVADMPDEAACLDTQAEVYWRLGDAKKAAAIETHALQIKPEDTYMAKQLIKFDSAAKAKH